MTACETPKAETSDASANRSRPPALELRTLTFAGQGTCRPIDNVASATRIVRLSRSFDEPFDRLDLSAPTWTPHFDGGYDWLVKRTLASNREEQIYVDPEYHGRGTVPLGLNPFRISKGVLSIVADRTPRSARDALYGFNYTSGLLTSRRSLVQRHGYFEMRARIPAGQALWPAFWLLPVDRSWPPEIDVLEVVGSQPEKMVMTAHWKGPAVNKASGCRIMLPSAAQRFHNFGVLWEPDRITWYIDRVPVASIATPQGFDKPMYMLVNLAVGGTMVGKAGPDTPLPAQLDVDHIAAWRLVPSRSASRLNDAASIPGGPCQSQERQDFEPKSKLAVMLTTLAL
jgi:beta-glucanase (GH16 family)